MIRYQHFPKSKKANAIIVKTVGEFTKVERSIASEQSRMDSNDVLEHLRLGLEGIGYKIEKGKKGDDKISVPVLYGENNDPIKEFFADGYNEEHKIVLEVEAAAAVANNRFLKDLFEACVMDNVDYCIIAVRISNNTSNNTKDYDTVVKFIDTIYASGKLTLPLKGVTIIGY